MSRNLYLFVDRADHQLDGEGLSDESLATCNNAMVQDHGNGVKVWITGVTKRKGLELNYSDWADLLRCARMMERERRLTTDAPLDATDMFVVAEKEGTDC